MGNLENEEIIDVNIQNQRVDFAKETTSYGLGLRVIKDNKMGFAHTTDISSLEKTVENAVYNARCNESDKNFPGADKVTYDEGIFVGYRHFEYNNIKPLFPFGYGLSYTTFKYDNIRMESNLVSGEDPIRVFIELENTGNKEGAEVVQLYLHDVESSLSRPFKELKGFKKVFLKPKQKKTIKFELIREDLAFFDEELNDWLVENGNFKILIGSSSENIHLETEFNYSNQN